MSLLSHHKRFSTSLCQDSLRQRILNVMWSSGVLVMLGEWDTQQHLGLRGDYCWKACYDDSDGHISDGHIEFGVWEWWMGRSRTLVHARIELHSLSLAVSSEVRAELNGAVLLRQDKYQLFDSVLDYIRELGRRW